MESSWYMGMWARMECPGSVAAEAGPPGSYPGFTWFLPTIYPEPTTKCYKFAGICYSMQYKSVRAYFKLQLKSFVLCACYVKYNCQLTALSDIIMVTFSFCIMILLIPVCSL